MKATVLYLSLLFCGNFSLKAQTVNGVAIKNFNVEYIQISGRFPVFNGPEINMLINYGQPLKALGNAETLLLDSSGKKMEFNSMIDALNFMSDNGYELTHPYGTENNSFLMRRKKTGI